MNDALHHELQGRSNEGETSSGRIVDEKEPFQDRSLAEEEWPSAN